MREVLNEPPEPPGARAPGVPHDLETICLKCLRKEPEKRYAGAADLADDLERFLDGRPIRARRLGAVEWAWRWCRRNPAAAGLVATAACLLAVLVAAALVRASMARERERELKWQADLGRLEKERTQPTTGWRERVNQLTTGVSVCGSSPLRGSAPASR